MSKTADLGPISPFFIVEELERSVGFYRDLLAFEVRLQIPEEKPFFAIVGRGEAQILLKEIAPEVKPHPNPAAHPWARWDAFVWVDQPDTLAQQYLERGVEFYEELKDWEDGLRGFATSDHDGYVVFFGRPI